MAREVASKLVDGKEYSFTQFGAKQGIKVLLRLGRIIGTPLAISLGAIKKESDGTETLNSSVLAVAIDELMKHADESEVENLLMLLTAESCLCDGKKVDFNSHYQGEYAHMFRVAKAALEVQYGNFLDALNEVGALPLPLKQAITKRSPT